MGKLKYQKLLSLKWSYRGKGEYSAYADNQTTLLIKLIEHKLDTLKPNKFQPTLYKGGEFMEVSKDTIELYEAIKAKHVEAFAKWYDELETPT